MSTTTNVLVLIPAPLRRYTGGEAKVTAGGATVAELIDNLDAAYPGIRDRIVENDGEVRKFVNIFVNGNNIRKLDGAATQIKDGDEVGIVPAMAGGCQA